MEKARAATEMKNVIILQTAEKDARLHSMNPVLLERDRAELLNEIEALFAAARQRLIR